VADDELFQSIGIDAQPIGSVSTRLAGHVIGPEDVSPSDEATDAVDWPTLHFCLKEAAYKAYYPMRRRRLGFHDMRLVIAPEARTFVAETIGQDSGLAFDGRYAVHDGRIHGACWYA
jgi:4'-phosphopantetheinyl transferase EntD